MCDTGFSVDCFICDIMKLSILIATIPCRASQFERLYKSILDQAFLVFDCVPFQVLYDDSLDYNIGTKRNKLLKTATGDYIVFVDDDDEISPDYISKILQATQSSPDCIGINGTISFNGQHERQWFISKEYDYWHEKNGIYYRTPNHISPVRREIALQAMFPEISFGEDAEYSKRILPLLKTEVVINEPIYKYLYVQK